MINRLLLLFKRSTSTYIIVNIFVSILGFIRSFIFLRWLDSEELGLISLVQTVMQFIGLLQFGLINGGYRIFSLGKYENQQKVNNIIFTYILILSIILGIIWIILVSLGKDIIINNKLLLVSLLGGLLLLTNNWLNNTLIAKRKLKEINKINIIAGVMSLSLLCLIPIIGLWGAVISIFIQPLTFVVFNLYQNKELRPTKLQLNYRLLKHILSFGFIPFLSGIFVICNLQIERWSIAGLLSTEALGCFYLVFLYNTLYLLVPNSILNIFFPQAVRSYDIGDIESFKKIIIKQFSAILLYDIFVVLLTLLFFKPLVTLLFPRQVDNIIYVYYFLPGLVFMSFTEVASLILNSTVRLIPILIGGIISVVLYIVSIPLFVKFHIMNLTSMSLLKSTSLILPCVVQFIYIFFNWHKILKRHGYKESN